MFLLQRYILSLEFPRKRESFCILLSISIDNLIKNTLFLASYRLFCYLCNIVGDALNIFQEWISDLWILILYNGLPWNRTIWGFFFLLFQYLSLVVANKNLPKTCWFRIFFLSLQRIDGRIGSETSQKAVYCKVQLLRQSNHKNLFLQI